MEAIIQDNYDLMALTELWDRPKQGWELEIKYPGRVFCSEATDETDPAAGAAIILSKRMAQRLMQVQAVGTRIIWCRIEGQFYNIIFISAYVPHKTRTDPTQAQNMQVLQTLCHTLQTKYPDDQMLIGADFNAKLQRSQQQYVGKYCMHYKNDSGGDQLMELMQHSNLCCASSYFASPKTQALGQGTYRKNGVTSQIDYILCSKKHFSNMNNCRVLWKRSIDANSEKYDHGLIRMGMHFKIKAHRKIPKSYNRDCLQLEENRDILDAAYRTATEEYNLQFPPLKTEDLTAKSVDRHHNAERKIQKSKTENAKEAAPPAINLTAKSVDDPANAERKISEKSESVVRTLNAEQKIQKSTTESEKGTAPPAINLTAESVDEPVNAERKIPEQSESVESPLNAERNLSEKSDQKEMERLFNRLQSSLKKAGDKLPVSKKKKRIHRGVSEEALDIIETRRRQVQGCKTRAEVRVVKNFFRPLLSRQARKDWRNHVEKQIDAVVEADARSDSKAWWQAIHRISGRSSRFNMTQPSADSLDELAETWALHCEARFEATAREADRTFLPISSADTRSDDVPSRQEILKHLEALSKSRAPGISGLPLELFLGSQGAMDDLCTIVQLADTKHEDEARGVTSDARGVQGLRGLGRGS